MTHNNMGAGGGSAYTAAGGCGGSSNLTFGSITLSGNNSITYPTLTGTIIGGAGGGGISIGTGITTWKQTLGISLDDVKYMDFEIKFRGEKTKLEPVDVKSMVKEKLEINALVEEFPLVKKAWDELQFVVKMHQLPDEAWEK